MSETSPALRRPLLCGASGIRYFLFAAAILLYAVAGSPTPDNLSAVEIIVGLLLVAAAGNFAIRMQRSYRQRWQSRAEALLLYGLSVPVVIAMTAGADPDAVLRDVIPFLFMLLPLFIQPEDSDICLRPVLTAAVAIAGIVFAARVSLHPSLQWLTGRRPVMADPLYLANAPTVLFSALLLIGMAGRELYAGVTIRRVTRAALLVICSFIPLAATVLAMQRASFFAVFFYIGALLLIAITHRPNRALVPIFAISLIAVAGLGVGEKIYHVMALKTQLVGANMRWQEAAAVFNRIGGNPFAVVFGEGWGARISSPAVGGETVNFTHSLLTSYWLKTGLCGLLLVLVYLFELGLLLIREIREYPVLGLALALPVLIDIFLYASFKSLDFGLVLLLIPLWAGEVASEGQKI